MIIVGLLSYDWRLTIRVITIHSIYKMKMGWNKLIETKLSLMRTVLNVMKPAAWVNNFVLSCRNNICLLRIRTVYLY